MSADAATGHADGFVPEMLREVAREFASRRLSPDYVAERADSASREPDAELWRAFAEMGWLGVAVTESDGGAGLGTAEQCILFEELGRALAPSPHLPVIALAVPLLSEAPDVLTSVIGGSAIVTAGWCEPDGPRTLSDPSRTATTARPAGDDWAVTGVKIGVTDLEAADAVIVTARDDEGIGLFLVSTDAPGVTITSTPSIDPTRPAARLTLNAAPGRLVAGRDAARRLLETTALQARLAATFEALGAADHLLQTSVDYACARKQFGKAIGAFQAIAGPLAERFSEISLARDLAAWALRAVEADDAIAPVAVAAALDAAAGAAVRTGETAIQVAGGIGFTWEHQLHRYLRRALWLEQLDGGGAVRRQEIASRVLDGAEPPAVVTLMDDADAAAFRAEVVEWSEVHLPTDRRGLELATGPDEHDRIRQAWQRRMADTGLLAAHWPVEMGGRGAPPLHTAIFREEAIRAHPRVSHGDGGSDLVAPLLMQYGTDAQRQLYLGAIRDESEVWAQGFSEPEAGSDLAALKTRAVRDGDGWVLSGSKTWTTYAPFAQWLFVLARTDPESVRHRGITCFIVPAHAPGVEIRPIRDIAGETEFGEVFLTDVRLGDEHVLGSVNDGWNVAIMTLANERVIESCEDIGELGFMVDRLLDCVRGLPAGTRPAIEDETVRDQVATIWCDLQAVRLMLHRSLVALTRTDMPEPDGSVLKLAWSELAQRVALLGVQRFGGASTADDRSIDVAAYWHHCYLMARATTIYAGTSEILRSVIAERVLGLPRSR
jgi:alkylation response protein AidB-like acyl-CoA dehydrogenase